MTHPALAQARTAVGRRWRRLARPRRRIGRTVAPLSTAYGYDRGSPVDRHYIDAFLRRHGADIRGRVLDVGDDDHARRFGTAVTQVDVLYPTPHPGATVIADLETGEGFPEQAFDCVLLLETLPFVYELETAVRAVHETLAPGGVVLATVNGIAPLDPDWPDFWRLTERSMTRLFAGAFGEENVQVETHGNALSAAAYLYGAAAEELDRRALDHRDPRFPVSVCLRARRGH